MVDITNKKGTEKKLVGKDSLSIRELIPPKERSTKKRTRRIPEPRLRPHQVKGRLYYYHCQGTREQYLGDADFILKAVTFFREYKTTGKIASDQVRDMRGI